MKLSLKTTILLVFFILPLLSFAQIPNSPDLINIKQYPAIPAPGEEVEIEVESFSTDLNGAAISWIVDGKTHSQGTGKTSITVKAPGLGKTMTITANILTVEGREVKKMVILKPGSVDIVWESQGFLPPFYKGKSRFVYENTLKVSAIPHLTDANGAQIDPKKLIYKWIVNDRVIQDQSGYDKQSLTYQEELPKDLEIKVEVSTPDGKSKATNAVTLSPGKPSLSFYVDDPLYGTLYNKALISDVTLENQEISIRTVPFFFNMSRENPLTYLWSVNNLERPDLSTQENIILRTKGDTEGTSIISIDVANDNILQDASGSLNVSFTKKTVKNNFSF